MNMRNILSFNAPNFTISRKITEFFRSSINPDLLYDYCAYLRPNVLFVNFVQVS